ncbi:MAG: hypothetical protein R8L58_08325 [Mariprofundaceae bacterium]
MNGLDWMAPEQLMSLFGSALILFAYGVTIARPERQRLYCSISLIGGVLLLAVALIYQNLGLILLEIAWIAVNIWGLFKTLGQEKGI